MDLMIENHISGLPVVDGLGCLQGIVTEADMLRRPEIGTAQKRPSWLVLLTQSGKHADDFARHEGRKVEDVMTREVVTATADTPIAEVVRLFERFRIKRLPVLRDGIIVGIVSRADIIRALAKLLPIASAARVSDPELMQRVSGVLAQPIWGSDSQITAQVQDGVVHLKGMLADPRERKAFRIAIENIPGVQGVNDDMVADKPTGDWNYRD
ncbi:MAG: CBS domain-containing protein [Acetobacteraceae bacterium]